MTFTNTFRSAWILVASLVILSACDRGKEVTVSTTPDSASVSLNGKLVGNAPIRVKIDRGVQNLHVGFEGGPPSGAKRPVPPGVRRTLTTAYIPLTAYLPLFVALDNGYFEQQGLEVKVIEATSPNDIVTAMVTGDIDFAAALAYAILFPAEIRYPNTFSLYSSSEETTTRYTSSIIIPKNSSIATYRELQGKKIGVYTGIVQVNFLKAILSGMGIPGDKVTIIQISPRLQIQGLLSGEYDALSSTEPTTNIAVLQGVAKVLISNPRVKFVLSPFPSTAAALATRLIREDPKAADAVVESLNMAIDFIHDNPDRAKESLLRYTPIPEGMQEEVLKDLRLFKYCKLGEENRLNVQRLADYFYETGVISERIPDVNRLFGDFEELGSVAGEQ